jgi:excisionase family DNA binding protein
MKEVLTTGEVARLCGVAPRTVSKWFDAGQLRGFKIPGSRDRRIPRDCLVRFMRAHGIPLRGLDGAITRVLLVDTDQDVAGALRSTLEREFNYDVHTASEVFESGLAARQFRPHVMFLDLLLPELNPKAMLRALRSDPELVATRVIAVDSASSEDRVREHLAAGFDACLAKPYDVRTLVRVIEEATDLVS